MADFRFIEDDSGKVGELPPIKTDRDDTLLPALAVKLYQSVQDLFEKFNGHISLGEHRVNGGRAGNLEAQYIIDFMSPVPADEAFEVPHGLGRVPIGYVVVSIDKPSIVYDGKPPKTWTDKSLWLKVSANLVSPDAAATFSLMVW